MRPVSNLLVIISTSQYRLVLSYLYLLVNSLYITSVELTDCVILLPLPHVVSQAGTEHDKLCNGVHAVLSSPNFLSIGVPTYLKIKNPHLIIIIHFISAGNREIFQHR